MFVISLASGSVQYAAMWAVNVSLVAGRRAYGSLRRRFLLQALTDAASRVDKAKAAAKVSASVACVRAARAPLAVSRHARRGLGSALWRGPLGLHGRVVAPRRSRYAQPALA